MTERVEEPGGNGEPPVTNDVAMDVERDHEAVGHRETGAQQSAERGRLAAAGVRHGFAEQRDHPAFFQQNIDNVSLILHDRDMVRKQNPVDAANADQAQARREQSAREHLLGLGADALDPRPWRPSSVPPSAVDLAHFALWRSAELAPEDVLSALALLPAARAEIDGLESGLLFTGRAAGLTWAQIADAMGFNSPQACQQHYDRLAARRGAGS